MADKSAYMSAGGYSSGYMGSNASSSGYAREDYVTGGNAGGAPQQQQEGFGSNAGSVREKRTLRKKEDPGGPMKN